VSPEVSERSFEEAIECRLLQYGPDACAGDTVVRETTRPFVETPPGGYRKRRAEDFDRALCLLPRHVVDFVLATQPKEWQKLTQHHGAAVKEQFLERLASEIERRGALDVLRNGVKDSGCKFRLAYFRPASGLNEETQRLHAAMEASRDGDFFVRSGPGTIRLSPDNTKEYIKTRFAGVARASHDIGD
jgi:type I restriction enzyme R subunit